MNLSYVKINSYKELCSKNEKLKLIGSQISLTPRSDHPIFEPVCCKRPFSATVSYETQIRNKSNPPRPKSAEFKHSQVFSHDSISQWDLSFEEHKKSDDSLTLSHFTNSSSKLLQNLIETSNCSLPKTKDRHFCSVISDVFDITLQGSMLNKNTKSGLKNESGESSEYVLTSLRKRETSDQENELQLKTHSKDFTEGKSECTIVKVFQSDNENQCFEQCRKSKEEVDHKKGLNLARENNNEHCEVVTSSNNILSQELPDFEGLNQLNSRFENIFKENNAIIKRKKLRHNGLTAETCKQSKCCNEDQNRNPNQKVAFPDSAYEEIVHLLQTLKDEGNSKSLNTKNKESNGEMQVSPEEKLDCFDIFSNYLEEVELQDISSHENYFSTEKWNFENFSSPRLGDLLNKNSVELAHEVFSLKIQVEEQKKGIKLLKDTLAEMKGAKKIVELEHQEALQKVNSESEVLVRRHQKFIKQLLNEKKNLNETVSKLVQDLKSGEEKYKKNIKAMEEKHLIEIKRAKDAQAIADKLKREKWLEIKTQKIKEMTIKGLEPELSRMAARQQEELTELRNLHKAEIEAIELRAARRNSELMDELRVELTKEKERAVAKEAVSLRTTIEKEFEEEKHKLQRFCTTLEDDIKKQEEKLLNQAKEFDQRLIDLKQEEEKKRQIILCDHEEILKKIQRQHLIELRNLRESLEAEKEVFVNNFKKQQIKKFFEKEAELHKHYKRERDRDIEIIIETLENETAQIQSELTVAGESKLSRLREKMEAELKEVEGNEAALKVKLTETKSELSNKEDFILELNSQIRKLQTELAFFKNSCEEMSLEKSRMKEIIREEFVSSMAELVKQKENLEKEMAVCKELHMKELTRKDQLNLQAKREMQKELARVYSRIKTAVSKKEKIIESLRQENDAISQKCHQLEVMLDHQRRNLLL